MSKSPEERTSELWSQNFDVLAGNLRFQTVTIPGTEISIVLTELNPYSFDKNQESWLYTPMKQMQLGDFYARYHPLRKMCLSLVVASDGGKTGACVQIVKASRIDPERGVPVPMPKQGDIVTYLGLRRNEIGRLMFLDDTKILYLIPTGRIVEKFTGTQDRSISARDADQELVKFFEQGRP